MPHMKSFRRRTAPTLFSMATGFAMVAGGAWAAEPATLFDPGRGGPGPSAVAARSVILGNLPVVTPAEVAARPAFRIGPLTGGSAKEFAARKTAAASGAGQASTVDRPTAPTPAQPSGMSPAEREPASSPLLLNFAGNSQSECAGAAPSDQAIAIGDGAGSILQVNQDCLSVWSAAGARLLGPRTLQAFAGLPASTYVFAPRALYDWYNHRFILAFGDSDLTDNSYYNVAVSQTDNPTGAWRIYRFRTPSENHVFNDFIRLGQDRQGVYVASNLFPMQGSCCGPYKWEEWVLLPKSLLYAGSALRYWYLVGMQAFNLPTDSTQPANVWSPYDNPRAEFFLGSFNINGNGGNCVAGCSSLLVWALSNAFGWLQGSLYPPVLSAVLSGSFGYSLPPQASQPGSPNSIDTLDTRITGGVTYSGGYLYGALTSGDSTWSDIQSYKVAPFLGADDAVCVGLSAGLCPRVTSAQTIDSKALVGGGNFYYFPAAQPDLEGNVTVAFNFSGPCAGCFPSVGFVSERVGTPFSNFVDNGQIFRAGARRSIEPSWGRYTAVAPSKVGYVAGGSVERPGVGVAGAFVKPDGSWGTQIGYTGYTSPNQP